MDAEAEEGVHEIILARHRVEMAHHPFDLLILGDLPVSKAGHFFRTLRVAIFFALPPIQSPYGFIG